MQSPRTSLLGRMIFGALLAATALPANASGAPTVSVRGSAVDDHGRALSDITLYLCEARANACRVAGETRSLPSGDFSFSGKVLPVDGLSPAAVTGEPARWLVVGVAPGKAVITLPVPSLDANHPLIVTLPPEQVVTGRFVDAHGAPLVDAVVSVLTLLPESPADVGAGVDEAGVADFGQFVEPAITNLKGQFRLLGLPPSRRVVVLVRHSVAGGELLTIATGVGPFAQGSGELASSSSRLPQVTLSSGFTHPLGAATAADELDARVQAEMAEDLAILLQSRIDHGIDPNAAATLATLVEQGVVTSPTLPDPSDLAPRTTVAGSVVDEESGAGVAGIEVTFLMAGESDASSARRDRRATTNDQGEFELRVPAGDVTVRMYSEAHRHHPTYDIPDLQRWRSKHALSPGFSAQVQVVSGVPAERARLSVNRGLTIRGQVVGADGRAAPDARLSIDVDVVFPFADSSLAPGIHRVRFDTFSAAIDSAGRFELTALPPNSQISGHATDAQGKQSALFEFAPDIAAPGVALVEMPKIVLADPATVRGQILCDGRPLPDVRVTLVAPLKEVHLEAGNSVTDANGQFVITHVASGIALQIQLQFNPDAPNLESWFESNPEARVLAVVEPNSVVDVPVISLRSTNSAVSGVVVDADGAPLPGVLIDVTLPDGRRWSSNGELQLTGQDGRFLIGGLLADEIVLNAWQFTGPEDEDRRPIAIGRMTTTAPGNGIRLVLQPATTKEPQ